MKSELLRYAHNHLPASVKRAMAKAVNRIAPEQVIGDLWLHRRQLSWLEHSLENIRRLAFNPRTIIDAGAFRGDFYRSARRLFPEASIHMIEAQESKIGLLNNLIQLDPRASVTNAVLGANDGIPIEFYELESGSSAYKDLRGANAGTLVAKELTTLDSALAACEVLEPVLLKLDVQGYELEVLRGASKTLQATEIILTECSLVRLNEGCPLFDDVLDFMNEHNFALYDLCTFFKFGPHRRLRQVDAIFVRLDSSLQGLL
jgi:FkbM family methyltransferase